MRFEQEKIGVQSGPGAIHSRTDTPTLLRTHGWAVTAPWVTECDMRHADAHQLAAAGARPGRKRPSMGGTQVQEDNWTEFCTSLLI